LIPGIDDPFADRSIIEGYAADVVVEFCTNYMAGHRPIGVPWSRHEGRLAGMRTLEKCSITPDPLLHASAHFMVLTHMSVVDLYINEHKSVLRRENPNKSAAWITKAHNKCFNHWFKERMYGIRSSNDDDEVVAWLARGPQFTTTTWQGYDINGYTFYTRDQDKKSTYQNSGVRVEAYGPNNEKSNYYGFIEEIWELDYITMKIPMFRCRWVHLKGVHVEDHNFTTVDLRHPGFKEEPFVLAKQVAQVFYIIDPKNRKRHVVRNGKRSIVGVDGVVDVENYNHFDIIRTKT
jgi:hypothetical protein